MISSGFLCKRFCPDFGTITLFPHVSDVWVAMHYNKSFFATNWSSRSSAIISTLIAIVSLDTHVGSFLTLESAVLPSSSSEDICSAGPTSSSSNIRLLKNPKMSQLHQVYNDILGFCKLFFSATIIMSNSKWCTNQMCISVGCHKAPIVLVSVCIFCLNVRSTIYAWTDDFDRWRFSLFGTIACLASDRLGQCSLKFLVLQTDNLKRRGWAALWN